MHAKLTNPATLRAVACVVATGTLAALSALSAFSAEKTPAVATLEQLVSQWVDLRGEIESEKREWEEQSACWHAEIELLEAEKAALEQELEDTSEIAASREDEREELLRAGEQMTEDLAALAPALDRAEARALPWRTRIPSPLAAPLLKTFDEIPVTNDESSEMSVAGRLQFVITVYMQIEVLQHDVHVSKEILPIETGRKQEMDVLYLGLSRAFAVSRDDESAATGIPNRDGWKWTSDPTLAGRIRTAISVFNRERPAELIDLPLATTGGTPVDEGPTE
jgi:hypothetical protein